MNALTILPGDCRQTLASLPAESVQCCVTSPPYYGLRDYGCTGQIGLEKTPEAFVAELVAVFREVRRVLRPDGTLWLNLGDSYSTHAAGRCKDPMKTSGLAGVKTQGVARSVKAEQEDYRNSPLPEKNLLGIPWRVAFALQADGWILRQDIIWSKPNPMPESVTDRCTKAHEYLFLLSKSPRYYFNADAIKEPVSGTAAPRMSKAALAEIQRNRDAGASPTASNPNGHGINPKSRVEQFQTASTSTLKTARALPVDRRNKRSVWTVGSRAYSEAHFATFPPDLIRPCILAGSRGGDTIIDPFGGSGTTGMVAAQEGRAAILCELNLAYCALIRQRCDVTPGFAFDAAPTPEGRSVSAPIDPGAGWRLLAIRELTIDGDEARPTHPPDPETVQWQLVTNHGFRFHGYLYRRRIEALAPVALPPFEVRAEAALAHVYQGIHHVPGKIKKLRGYWEVVIWGSISTHDFDQLTRMVIAAHEHCVRIELQPCNCQHIRLLIHPRQQTGGICERHPSLTDLAERARRRATPTAHHRGGEAV